MQQQELGIKQGGTYVWKKQKHFVFSVKDKKIICDIFYVCLKKKNKKKENCLIPFLDVIISNQLSMLPACSKKKSCSINAKIWKYMTESLISIWLFIKLNSLVLFFNSGFLFMNSRISTTGSPPLTRFSNNTVFQIIRLHTYFHLSI